MKTKHETPAEIAARCGDLVAKIAGLEAQRDAARKRAAEAAADGLDGSAHHFAAAEIEAEINVLRDGLDLARQRHDAALKAEDDARVAAALAGVATLAKARLRAAEALDAALEAADLALKDFIDSGARHAAACREAGLKVRQGRDVLTARGAMLAVAPQLFEITGGIRVDRNLRQPARDVVAGQVAAGV